MNKNFLLPTRALALLITLILSISSVAQEDCGCSDGAPKVRTETSLADTNIMCPVMPESEAEDLWTTVYKGKVIRFCCNNCIELFRHEPEKYLANVPQFQGAQTAVVAATAPKPKSFSTGNIKGILLLLGSLFACYFVLGWDRYMKQSGNKSQSLLIPIAVATVCLTHAWKNHNANQQLRVELLREKVKSKVHRATYYDYGVPPVPDNPQLQPELSKSFYRGNDERSPVLYNGGNYQTAQFDIQIQHADGTPVKIGDELTENSLYIKFSIQKPENAPKRMYDRKMMSRMFMTRSYADDMGWEKPVEDKAPLQVVKEDERWSCRFALDVSSSSNEKRFNPKTVTQHELAKITGVGASAAQWFTAYRDAGYPITGPEDLRQAGITGEPADIISASLDQSNHGGLVYVCEAILQGEQQVAAAFHYGIKYDLKVEDGRIVDGSEIWMGALNRSLKAKKGAIPDDQWLSSEPLPQLPAAQQISDKLLGIDDYEF